MKRAFALILALAMTLGCAALAEDSVLRVSGSGTVYMQADRASASLGVMMTGEDLGELQQRANNTVAAIVDALKAAGLDETNISTNYINISPRYDYSGEIERMVGYSIDNTLTISTDEIDSIGSYIDAAFAAGANSFDSIEFGVKDDSAARKQALELAVQDAQSKAETIASAAGQTLAGIEEINEGTSSDYSYYNSASGGARYPMAEVAMDAAAGVTVRAAQIRVSADVQIVYELQ